jgi:hypothetical protein
MGNIVGVKGLVERPLNWYIGLIFGSKLYKSGLTEALSVGYAFFGLDAVVTSGFGSSCILILNSDRLIKYISDQLWFPYASELGKNLIYIESDVSKYIFDAHVTICLHILYKTTQKS